MWEGLRQGSDTPTYAELVANPTRVKQLIDRPASHDVPEPNQIMKEFPTESSGLDLASPIEVGVRFRISQSALTHDCCDGPSTSEALNSILGLGFRV